MSNQRKYTREELQQMLDSFSESVKDVSEGDIDSYINAQSMGKEWGVVQGKKNLESGHWDVCKSLGGKVVGNVAKDKWLPDARIKGGSNSHLVSHTCPHCGYSEDGPNIFKSHFDNCIGIIDVFKFHIVGNSGERGQYLGSYNNQSDILNEFSTMSKSVLSQAVNGQKKKYHPNFVGGYVVIPRGTDKI